MSQVKVLVVDDTASNRRLIQAVFEAEGCQVTLANSGDAALELIKNATPDVVLLDMRMPGMDGLETLRRLRSLSATIPVLILTSHSDMAAAVEATKLGAADFVTRPINNDELVVRVVHAIDHRKLVGELESLRSRINEGEFIRKLTGRSAGMNRVVTAIRTVAKSNFTVLILGETGTGKELVARAVHQESERGDKAFVAVDCGALTESIAESELFGHEKGAFTGADRRKVGYFEASNGGTLFLDEVGNLPLSAQVKLLRVIQERELRPVGSTRALPIDVRIIAATNERLESQISGGRFRSDLYYRLAEYSIDVPALRDRQKDIPLLARRFMEEAALELRRSICSISPKTLGVLSNHTWPGNVRELRNAIRIAVMRSSGVVIEPEEIQITDRFVEEDEHVVRERSVDKKSPAPLRQLRASIERNAITEALRTTGGNKAAAARLLGVDVKTLYTKLRRYRLIPAVGPDERLCS